MITLSTPVVLNIVSGTIVNGDTITIPSEQTGPFILSLELIGNVYVETYEAATTKYYGLSYRKDDEGDKLLILNGEGTTLTAKTFPLSGDNGIETIEVSNGTHNSDGSYTYTLPKKPTSNPYILKTVDSGESDYYLMTGDSEISFGMRPIALTDSFFGGNFMVVSGTTATQRPTNFPPQPKSADNGKVLTVKDGYPSWETAGGGGFSPILNLMNIETDSVRTSITEEEKNNLDKGLYNSVYYYDESWGKNAEISITLPQLLTNVSSTMYMATIYTGSMSEDSASISGLLEYRIEIGEKNTDGTYPITIVKAIEIPFAADGGGGGGGDANNYLVKDIVDDSVTLTNDEFKKLAESNCTLVLRRVNGNNTWYYISSVKVVSSENGAVSEIQVTAFAWMNSGNISVSDSYVLTFAPDRLTSNVTRTEISTSPAKLFNKFNVLTNDFTLTNILPCSAIDNGKALSVVNGEAQWADLGTTYSKARYEHTITIKNSEGKILWTQTMRNSSNTVVNSYANLKTLFGEATYAGFGEYCQLNLEGGTEATDKLIKADGTEATLASLGAIVYTDVCFLPK